MSGNPYPTAPPNQLPALSYDELDKLDNRALLELRGRYISYLPSLESALDKAKGMGGKTHAVNARRSYYQGSIGAINNIMKARRTPSDAESHRRVGRLVRAARAMRDGWNSEMSDDDFEAVAAELSAALGPFLLREEDGDLDLLTAQG